MKFSTRRAAAATGLSQHQVRGYVRAGLVGPRKDARGAFRFTFQDVVVLRTGKRLNDGGISTWRIRREMARLRGSARPLNLSAVQMSAQDGSIVVRDGQGLWEPTTGQFQIPFEQTNDIAEVTSRAVRMSELARLRSDPTPSEHDGEWWFEEALRLEENDAVGARAAYRESIAQDPGHPSAHANLGRLLHEQGSLAAAETHYRQALLAEPDDPTAAYNLGVVLEDLGDQEGALDAYLRALDTDPDLAAAHFNAGRLLEAKGERAEALGHFVAYRRMEQTT